MKDPVKTLYFILEMPIDSLGQKYFGTSVITKALLILDHKLIISTDRQCNTSAGLEINISRQWTIGPPVLDIRWSCQISGGPDVANRHNLFVKSNTADIIYLFLFKAFEQSLQWVTPCNT